MFDLVYPMTPAPDVSRSFKRPPFGEVQPAKPREEMLPIVDISGLVVAQAPRSFCHSPERPLHPVVHLHIINRRGELFLQKRAMTKDLLPGYWDTAVGGHVGYGEHIQEALFRETSEELGLAEFNPVFLGTYIWETDREREMACTFAAVGDFHLDVHNDEVDEGRFWPMEEIEVNLGKSLFTPNFENEFARVRRALEALL